MKVAKANQECKILIEFFGLAFAQINRINGVARQGRGIKMQTSDNSIISQKRQIGIAGVYRRAAGGHRRRYNGEPVEDEQPTDSLGEMGRFLSW